VRRRCPI